MIYAGIYTTKIVLSLEFFIAVDLIKSILQPTLTDLIVLAVIVAIRTALRYPLNVELKNYLIISDLENFKKH